MTAYRDDLEAALAHAEAAEKELATAREELTKDHDRIAELERELAAAKRGIDKAKRVERRVEPKPAPPAVGPRDDRRTPRPAVAITVGIVVAALVIGGMVMFVGWQNGPSYPVVDLVADEAAARELAKKWIPDPELFELRADYVDPRGTSDLARFGGRVYRRCRRRCAARSSTCGRKRSAAARRSARSRRSA